MKICKKCKKKLPLTEFTRCSKNRGGLEFRCKTCRADARKQYYSKNKEAVLKRNSEYYQQNREQIQKKNKKYWDDMYKNNPEFRLAAVLRRRLRSAIIDNTKTGSAVEDLGCSIEELKSYLESKFQPGMTWDNYGEWHIDHIVPLASFNLSDRVQLSKACNYTNLQPLWAKDNLCKSNKIQQN